MKNAVHLPLGSEEGGNVSENEGQTPPKRGRRPGTRDHDESKITHGPGVCPHCEKVRILFLNKIEIRVFSVKFKYQFCLSKHVTFQHYQKLRHHVQYMPRSGNVNFACDLKTNQISTTY